MKKFEKMFALATAIAMVVTLAACGGNTSSSTASASTVGASAEAPNVQVEKFEVSTVTAVVGELSEGQAGGPPDMPEGQAPSGEMEAGSPPDVPSEEMGGEGGTLPGGSGAMADGEIPPQAPPGGMGGGMAFVPGDETITFEITDNTAITVEFLQGSEEGSVDDIVVGAILEVTLNANDDADTILVRNLSAGGDFGGSGEVNQGTAANTIDADGTYSGQSYTSSGDDENALRVVGATVTLEDSTVEKTAGATSSTEDGDFYGMNAGLLATDGADVTITGATVNTSAQNGNGVFSYGEGTTVTISDSAITTTADNSGGIQTTGGGTMNANNLIVNTAGNSAAAIRSDRGGGTVMVDGGSYTSTGINSPAVYSTADITVSNATLIAENSEALVIEGKNSIVLVDCDVEGNMSDTEGTSSQENVHNVMIYQSMSGDADIGTSSFSMTGGTLVSNNGDTFYVTNTHSVVTLSGVTIENRETDGYLFLVSGNSATHGWGTAGANGAQVEFTADAQELEGDIAVDTVSTLDLSLTNGSTLTGTVNIIENAEDGTAVEENAMVTIDADSTWTLTGDCALTSLTNNGTIHYNGYTITLADGTVLDS